MLWYSLEAPLRNKNDISIFRMKKVPYLLLWVNISGMQLKLFKFLMANFGIYKSYPLCYGMYSHVHHNLFITRFVITWFCT